MAVPWSLSPLFCVPALRASSCSVPYGIDLSEWEGPERTMQERGTAARKWIYNQFLAGRAAATL